MKKTIKLNSQYRMIIEVTYCKNVSEGTAKYEVESKIVKEEDYLLNEKPIGEIEGHYFSRIPVRFYKYEKLNKLNQQRVKKKVSKSITHMHKLSKALVGEWKNYDIVMKEAECTIEKLVRLPA